MFPEKHLDVLGETCTSFFKRLYALPKGFINQIGKRGKSRSGSFCMSVSLSFIFFQL